MAAILWYMSIIALQSVSIVPCPLWRIVLDTTLCDKVLQLLAAGRWWFLTNIPVGLINTTNRHDIIEINISLKALNTFDLDRLLLYHVMNGVDLYGKWDKLLDIYCHYIQISENCQAPFFTKESWWSWWYGSWIYNYLCNQCQSPPTLWVIIPFRRDVLDTTLCDEVCQWLAIGRWFYTGTPVSSTNKTDRHDITEILLKLALNTIVHPTHLGLSLGCIWKLLILSLKSTNKCSVSAVLLYVPNNTEKMHTKKQTKTNVQNWKRLQFKTLYSI